MKFTLSVNFKASLHLPVHNFLKQDVYVKHQCPLQQQSPKTAIFIEKVIVKVTSSLTLVPFERLSLIEHARQMKILTLIVQSYGQG